MESAHIFFLDKRRALSPPLSTLTSVYKQVGKCFPAHRAIDVNSDKREILKKIKRNFDACQVFAHKSQQFEFTLKEDKDFHHTIYASIF